MVGGIDSTSNLLNMMYGTQNTSSVNKVSAVYDYKAAQTETKALLDSYKTGSNQVSQLKKDTSEFLDSYTKNMNSLNSAAGALTNGGIDKLLYDKEGEVTEDTIKATVDAVQNMVTKYNDTLKFLGNNAERGAGVEKQIARMSDDPATKKVMEMVGMSVNADGTMALDASKLTEALNDTAQRDLYKDILAGSNGIAASVQRDAQAGLNRSAGSLVGSDIAKMREAQNDDPIRSFAQSMNAGGAYGYNNMAAIGILMNMSV